MIEIDGVQYEKILRPLKAMREKCIDCCGGMIYEPKQCTATKCPLHPYRLGKRPVLAPDRNAGEGSGDCDGEE